VAPDPDPSLGFLCPYKLLSEEKRGKDGEKERGRR